MDKTEIFYDHLRLNTAFPFSCKIASSLIHNSVTGSEHTFRAVEVLSTRLTSLGRSDRSVQ